eukprot:maker-scaffold36_size508890-snap-gene-4.13 protein:Tk03716 transcript:maker-scaffold36_size508890-snap-gene-4.13-mRNA-1 annotation:"hypothetical protein T265_05296"
MVAEAMVAEAMMREKTGKAVSNFPVLSTINEVQSLVMEPTHGYFVRVADHPTSSAGWASISPANRGKNTETTVFPSESKGEDMFWWVILTCLSPALAQWEFSPHPIKPGPWVDGSRGQIWPQPQSQQSSLTFYSLNPDTFQFQADSSLDGCEIVANALARFFGRVFPPFGTQSIQESHPRWNEIESRDEYAGELGSILVALTEGGKCESVPYFGMDESYSLVIAAPAESGPSSISSSSVWGLLKGLESFSQLAYSSADNLAPFQINVTTISDWPRFPHRGFMIDTSRHFLHMSVVKQTLDLMEMNKLNVLHWHLVDDQSFPYQSTTFPNMSLYGAYHPYTRTYSQGNIQEIIQWAHLRGIRVIPEFDTPGHTQSWELGQPGLLTPCYKDGTADGTFGPMDPSKESLFEFLTALLTELSEVFPDDFFHIGGDEVDTACWESNPDINAFMDYLNISGEYRQLESYHVEKVLDIISKLSKKTTSIVWQEVFDNGDNISPDTLVHVWKGGWQETMNKATEAGFPVLLSAPFYLDLIQFGSDWIPMYEVEPLDFEGTEEQKQLVQGGEACMWAEWVNSGSIISRSWPRGSAFAERFWSARSSKGEDMFWWVILTCLSPGLAQWEFSPHPIKPGAWVDGSRGQIWPQPQSQQSSLTFYSLNPDTFQFQVDSSLDGCEIVANALARFFGRVFPPFGTQSIQESHPRWNEIESRDDYAGELGSILVALTEGGKCESVPYFGMDESYSLVIAAPAESGPSSISSSSVWGLLMGLESFSQLAYSSADNLAPFQINVTTISDWPRFPHRGFMIDTSRHFLHMRVVKQTLDLMEMNKLNVLHWHLVDDQSFPYQSTTFPNMSLYGAYHPYTRTYSQGNIQEIIQWAHLRGIRVIPEFDTPGHTQSWELGQPGLLTPCYKDGTADGTFGPMDPSKESLFEFLTALLTELSEVFPDDFFHIGGDEVDTACWESNPDINAFMDYLNISGEYRQLESYHVEKVLDIISKLSKKTTSIVWQEVFDNGDNISPDTLVHVWKAGWQETMTKATKAGFPVLLSAPFYLNRISYGSDWVPMYEVEPLNFEGTEEQKQLEHECRMLQRGYRVGSVVGPSSCEVDWEGLL